MISFFGNKSRVRQFNFIPRYYDEAKEEMEERYRRIQAEIDSKSLINPGTYGGSLKERWKRNKNTSHFEKKSSIRIVIIVMLLIGICHFILTY